jgi:hypothetical protein
MNAAEIHREGVVKDNRTIRIDVWCSVGGE